MKRIFVASFNVSSHKYRGIDMSCSRIIVAPDVESAPAVLHEFYRNLGIEDGCRYEIRNVRIDDTLRQIG